MIRNLNIDTSTPYGAQLFDFLTKLDFVNVMDTDFSEAIETQISLAEKDIENGQVISFNEVKNRINDRFSSK